MDNYHGRGCPWTCDDPEACTVPQVNGEPCDACEGTGNGRVHGVDDYCGKCDATGRVSAPLANNEPYCTDCGGRPGDHSPECTKGDLAIKVPDLPHKEER